MKPSRHLTFISIGLISTFITLFLYSQKIPFLTALDLKLMDARLKLRGEARPDSKVVIVAIDEKSMNELGRWPWDRDVIARLVEGLSSYGVETVAFDMVFSEPSNAPSDTALSEAIRRAGNVVAGYFFSDKEQGRTRLIERSGIKVVKMAKGAKMVPMPAYPYVEANIAPVSDASLDLGFFNIIPDSDGIVRRASLLMLHNAGIYPSLPLASLRHYLYGEITLDIGRYGVEGLYIGDRHIPVNESGVLTLNYYGGQGAFRTVSAADVIHKRIGDDTLKNAIALIGITGVGIYDVNATPLDPVLPGVEIIATVLSNVLQGSFLIRDGRVIMLEITLIIAFPILLTTLLSLVRRTWASLLLFMAVLFVYSYLNQFLFTRYLLDIGILFPILSTSVAYLGSEAYRNLVEEREGRFIKKAFSSYVSPELVNEIMRDPKMLKLGGERREVTVLFSDIRDFTAISERLSPEDLVALLNRYFKPMTDIIIGHKGTLDKYIGDAIMAIYNAPLDVREHSALACKSAIEMVEKLEDVNRYIKKTGLPEIGIGIGIHTGDAVVGNMGTDVRFEYTAVGDTVNLASRLEGLNKVYQTHIIVSEFTVGHCTSLQTPDSRLLFREIDLIKVKGRDRPVLIYELSSRLDAGLIKGFEEGLRLYRGRRFQEAREIFQSLYEGSNDMPSMVFAQRCIEFIENPPDASWDGVYVAESK